MDVTKKSVSDATAKAREVDKEDRVRLDLRKYVPALLTVLYNRLSNESSKRYRKWFSVGVTDWRVLAFLGVYRKSTAAHISRAIALDKAAISRSITFLRKRNFVEIKHTVGRRVVLQLTMAGEARFEEILGFALVQEHVLLSGFSDNERAVLLSMLDRMIHNLHDVVLLTPQNVAEGRGQKSPNKKKSARS